MFLNRFIHKTKIINWQRPLKRHFSGNPRGFTNKFGDKTATLVGLGCSLTILSTFGLAYSQTKNSETEEEEDKNADSLLGKENPIITERDEGHRNGTEDIQKNGKNLKKSAKKSLLHLQQVKEEFGTPGLICAVSVDGEVVLNAGIGFSDVENAVKCNGDTKMRIASISKALTSIGIGKLLQEGKIELDAPIQKYVKYFPEKKFDNEAVTITTRQLMSHTSGIRHYDKNPEGGNEKEAEGNSESNKKSCQKCTSKKEFDNKEYYIKDHFDTTKDAAKLFQDDPLLKKPGTEFLYSTHAWTLLSGVIEEASGMDYVSYMKNLCYDLGLDNTLVELNDPIIYNRSRNYSRNGKGKLRNSPYVDNSYKISGGGFLSTAKDLLKIGNVMLYCHQNEAVEGNRDGYLKKETIDTLWTTEPATNGKVSKVFKNLGFGLGWKIQPEASDVGCCRSMKFAVTHSGGAVGASSVLLIIPQKTSKMDENKQFHSSPELISNKEFAREKPHGMVIAIMVNMQDVGLLKTAFKIAENFEEFYV